MNIKEILTKDLVDELVSRMNTCLILGMVFDHDNTLTFHRRFSGPNSWAMYAPLLAEIRWLNGSYDSALDEPDLPDSTIDF